MRKDSSSLFLCGLLFCLASVLNGQSAALSGEVMAEGKPLPFATVSLQEQPISVFADILGRFTIDGLEAGSYTLVARMLGHQFTPVPVQVSAGDTVRLTIVSRSSSLALNEVVVSANLKETGRLDSPLAVEVYSDQFFKANPTPSVFESLQNVNGVRPQLNCNVCNTGDIHINGLEGPYTMVLIDGMPIVSGLSSVYGLTGIPQSLIERIEVVKGPASTLYGSEAVGGLINVITKKVRNAPRLSVDAFGTDWGEVNTDVGLRFGVGEGAHSLLGLNHFYYQRPIDKNGDGFTDVTLQHRFSAFNKWSFDRPEARLFSVAGRYIYEDRWGGDVRWDSDRDRGGDELYGESIYTSRWEFFGTYQLPIEESVYFTFSANGHQQNSYYGDVPYFARQHVTFGQLSWDKSLGHDHELLLGVAYRQTNYDDNTPATSTFDTLGTPANLPALTRLPGVFLQDEWTLSPRHKLLLGIRYDRNSAHGGILSPRFNYKYTAPNRQTALRAGIGNGYRVANVFTEDHAALTGAREVVFASALRPETSWNANLNLVRKIYFNNNTFLSLDATAFYTYFNNRIIPDYESNPNQIIYDNLEGEAVSRGLSLNLEATFPSGLNILAGATLMDVSQTEAGERKQQLLTERWSGVWSVSYRLRRLRLKLDYTGNIYGPMRLPLLGELDDRPAYSPVWSIQNLQLTKEWGRKTEVFGGVKNLLDFTPAANSIARSFDPFDRQVTFGADGQVVPTADNPNALTFDPTYVYAPNQGIRFFLGFRYTIE